MCGESMTGTARQNAKISSGPMIHWSAPITRRAKSWSRRKGRTKTWHRASNSLPCQSSSPMQEIYQRTPLLEENTSHDTISQRRQDQCDRLNHRGPAPRGTSGGSARPPSQVSDNGVCRPLDWDMNSICSECLRRDIKKVVQSERIATIHRVLVHETGLQLMPPSVAPECIDQDNR